jgi:hypothetical protein
MLGLEGYEFTKKSWGFDKTNRRGNITNQTSNAGKMQGKEIQVGNK